jgi:glycosyltransferase involved in cell wall biosynthesis
MDKAANGPLVSVLLPTFNRPVFMAHALASIVAQEYRNLQIVVVNDGGQDVKGVVESFNDPRICFINRRQNRGLPFTLNEALAQARGKYVCYLGDDDLFYPYHVGTLVDALENRTDCLVAYSDLYKVYCRVNPDKTRTALSKIVNISRDFDRFVMLYFNHVLHVSCLHRRDLLDKTGPYNESLNVLIDWDLIRRLAFFTDFFHVHNITGEFFQPEGDKDRISVKRRKDKSDYTRNALTIRTARPAKPWTKLKDLSIIFTARRINQKAAGAIGLIWRYTFYPYKLYLGVTGEDSAGFKTDMPNVVIVPVEPNTTELQRVDRLLEQCEGDYVGIVPEGFPIRDMWIEDSLYALLNGNREDEAIELEDSTPGCRAIVVKKEHLQLARAGLPHLEIQEGLTAVGINIRRPRSDEIPFQFDTMLKIAETDMQKGDYKKAALTFEYMGNHYHNQLWMKSMAAEALFKAGDVEKAAEFVSFVNSRRPTVETLLLEAKIRRRKQDFNGAVTLLNQAEDILAGGILTQAAISL